MNQSWLLFLLFSVDTFCTASTRIRGSTQRIYDPKTMMSMSLELECLAANDMTPSEGVVWRRASGDGLPGTASTNNPLTLSDLQQFRDNPHSFEDQYTCTYGGITSNPVSVYVLPKPTRQDDIEQSATVGERETIECPLLFGILHMDYTVSWTENGHMITNGSEGYLIRRDPNESLIISDVTQEHMANYQCTASLSGLHPMSSPVVQLMPYQAPKILNIGPADPVVVADGSIGRVTCNVSGFPKPEVEWCVNEACSPDWPREMRYSVIPLPSDEGSTTYLSTLQISPVREEDSGNITCRVTSNNTIATSTTELFVPYRIGIHRVIRTNGDKVVVEVVLRREIRFAYKVAIFANDRLQETFDGQQGNISHNYTLTSAVQGNISAQIQVGEHHGRRSEIQAVPQQAPKILNIGPADPVVVADGSAGLVTCEVNGFPKLEVEWCVNEACSPDWPGEIRYSVISLPSNEGSTYLSILQISPVREEDSGNITCRVTSNNTTDTSTTKLIVLYQITIKVFRNSDDGVLVEVALRREIRFPYEVAIFVNEKRQQTFTGQQGKINYNYTLANAVQGEISAQIEVDDHRGQMSEIQAVPQRTTTSTSTTNSNSELSGHVIAGFISSALIVVILLLALLLVYIGIKFYKKRNQIASTKYSMRKETPLDSISHTSLAISDTSLGMLENDWRRETPIEVMDTTTKANEELKLDYVIHTAV